MTPPESLPYGPQVLDLDCAAEVHRIDEALVEQVGRLNRKGVVVGISGGIDSAVCAALAVHALKPRRVLGLLMPERESGPDSGRRAEALCRKLGIPWIVEDISGPLEALGCYRERDAAIRAVFPAYGPDWRQKITIGHAEADTALPFFELTVATPEGDLRTARLPSDVYLRIVAATNMKQRVRKLVEYTHAERLNYAVLGTPNRLEYELGFFVRGGDGLADLKPIAHLFKSQVYALAAHLDVPAEIQAQRPTTDTYSLPQSQDEFYFGRPYPDMDLLLYGWVHGVAPAEVGRALALPEERVRLLYREIGGKRRAARRGLQPALLVEEVAADFEDAGASHDRALHP